ncbi:MAG: HEAT repeat domain-containing protein [Aggregatilineales bacterium]
MLYEDNDVRQEIAIAILWEMFREHGYKHRDLVPALVSAIKANVDNNPMVVMDGMGLLEDLKESSAFEPLVEFLRSDEEEIRVGAVEALANLKDSRAVPHIAHLLNDEVEDVRNRSLWALNYIGTVEALSAIEKWKTKNETHHP